MSNLKVLITKLSSPTRSALEKSANYCINQLNYEIEIEHLFVELLNQIPANDLQILLKKNNISSEALTNDLKETIASLPKGNTRTPIFAKSIVKLFEQAWLLASAEQTPVIRSSHLIIALLTEPDLQQIAFRASSLFELFPIDTMKHKFLDMCGNSSEHTQIENNKTEETQSVEASSTIPAKTPALDQYTINLTTYLDVTSRRVARFSRWRLHH